MAVVNSSSSKSEWASSWEEEFTLKSKARRDVSPVFCEWSPLTGLSVSLSLLDAARR